MPQYMSNDKFRLVLPWHKRASLFDTGNVAGDVAAYLKYRKNQAAKVNPRVYSSTNLSHFDTVIRTVNIDAAAMARFAPMKGDLWHAIVDIAGTDVSRMRGESLPINIFVVCDDSEHKKLEKVEIVTRNQPSGFSNEQVGLWLTTVHANGNVDQPGRARAGARYGR